MSNNKFRVAVDTGGTFTDVVAVLHGQVRTHKLPSTPHNPADAVLEGVRHVLDAAQIKTLDQVSVVHGTTVSTNALLEGKWGRAALVTTAGFEDVLRIGRQARPELFALHIPERTIPVERALTFGVQERTLFDGQIRKALEPREVQRIVRVIRESGVEAVAVCLLHAYANPTHEKAIGEVFKAELPGVHVTLSHALLNAFREYERTATTVVNAVVAPIMRSYLKELSQAIPPEQLRIMGSSGGKLSVRRVLLEPARTALSGPAGGVVGAMHAARDAGFDRIVTFDMGGTSTDVAACNGEPTITHRATVGPLPVHLPMIDIHTVGAGGGSIAWVDAGGALRVGPHSAGARPGPAAYGNQSPDDPVATVTDANVVLGRLHPDRFLGGKMSLDLKAAKNAVQTVADRLQMDLNEVAEGICKVAVATMARAITEVSVKQGHDVREFALVTFGGAGGFHACEVAASLGMTTVIVPPNPGLLSAVGMLHAADAHQTSVSTMLDVDADRDGHYPSVDSLGVVSQAVERAEEEVAARFLGDGYGPEDYTRKQEADLRYAGQSFELTVPLGADLFQRFEQEHRRLYGQASPGRRIQIVGVRVRGTRPKPRLPHMAEAEAHNTQGVRPREGWWHLDRAQINETSIPGPVVLSEYSSTTVVPEGWSVKRHTNGSLILEAQPL